VEAHVGQIFWRALCPLPSIHTRCAAFLVYEHALSPFICLSLSVTFVRLSFCLSCICDLPLPVCLFLFLFSHTHLRARKHTMYAHIYTQKCIFFDIDGKEGWGGRERQKWSGVGWSLVLHWHIQIYKNIEVVAGEGSWQKKAGATAFKVLRWSQLLHTGRMFARLVSSMLRYPRCRR